MSHFFATILCQEKYTLWYDVIDGDQLRRVFGKKDQIRTGHAKPDIMYTNKVLHCVLGNSNRESLSQKVLKASESGALQTLKSKWWPEGDCADAAVVGSSAEKSMEVDIPHVGKFWKNTRC